jgi:hypothetical protein
MRCSLSPCGDWFLAGSWHKLNEFCIFAAKKPWSISKTFYVRIAAAKIFKRMVTGPMASNVGVV